jgi:tRNA A-37 threonylcarbamoyl transferase component Bud32
MRKDTVKKIGPYTLLRQIGEGGMGEVWLGRRPTPVGAWKLVAIKLLGPRHLEHEGLREMFLQEARLSMSLTHSNIVHVFDVVEDTQQCCMVMEWVDGLDLARFTAKLRATGHRLSQVQSVFIISKLLRALAYAHEGNHRGSKGRIIHRDISPQNVMLSVTGEVKLMDFGIARLSSDETSGLVRGKPRYMPPEQLAGKSREPTVDLFAVGAILHELLDNRKFRCQAQDDGELYGMIIAGRVPKLGVEIPPVLERVRAGLLEPDPSMRIPSARKAIELLDAWPDLRDVSFELEALVREFVDGKALRDVVNSLELRTEGDGEGEGELDADGDSHRSLPDAHQSTLQAVPVSHEPESERDTIAAVEDTPRPSVREEQPEVTQTAPKVEATAPSLPNRAGMRSPSPKRSLLEPLVRPAGVLVVGLLSVWLLVSLFSGRGPSESITPSPTLGWSKCFTATEFHTCTEACEAEGASCTELGCPIQPSTCTWLECERATQALGFDLVCQDLNSGVFERSSCDTPIAFSFRSDARCCCAGLRE